LTSRSDLCPSNTWERPTPASHYYHPSRLVERQTAQSAWATSSVRPETAIGVSLVRSRHVPHPDTYGAGPGRGLRICNDRLSFRRRDPCRRAVSRAPRRRLSRGGLGDQGQVALPLRNRRRIAPPPAHALPMHPYRRTRWQLVMRGQNRPCDHSYDVSVYRSVRARRPRD
jgi:hypothetical protein